MNKFVLWISLLFAGFSLCAQGENDYIPFFNGRAIKWNGNNYISDTCANRFFFDNSFWKHEGQSSICDKLGQLKFYTNGFSLYNNKHETIDDGYLACLSNDTCTSLQGTLFLPFLSHTFFFL